MSKMLKDEFFMGVAKVIAKRGTCDRMQVGSVLVYNDQIISTGFNGAPRGLPDCDEVGHLIVGNHCKRSLHSENNTISEIGYGKIRRFAAKSIVTIYVTAFPCRDCMHQIVQAGIRRVVFYRGEYCNDSIGDLQSSYCRAIAALAGISLEQYQQISAVSTKESESKDDEEKPSGWHGREKTLIGK
jgi:deoxycytidylate deaminase